MKKLYESPKAEQLLMGSASFLETSGNVGDAVAVDIFEGSYGSSF